MITDGRLVTALWKPSYNCGRPGSLRKPRQIVIHYTAGRNAASAASWLCMKAAKASAHLVIGRGGELYQLVAFDTVAWHAKQANSSSIGIELDNPGPLQRVNGVWRSLVLGTTYPDDDVIEARHINGGALRGWLLYTQAQIELTREICRALVEAYPTIKDCTGHEDVDPTRKTDPGPAWDMEALRTSVFGRV